MMSTQLYNDATNPAHHKYAAHQVALLYVSAVATDRFIICMCTGSNITRSVCSSQLHASRVALIPAAALVALEGGPQTDTSI